MLSILLYLVPLGGILAMYRSARVLEDVCDEPAGDASVQARQRLLARGAGDLAARAGLPAAASATVFAVVLAATLGIAEAFSFLFGSICCAVAGYRSASVVVAGAARVLEAQRGGGSSRADRLTSAAAASSATFVGALGMTAIASLHWFFGDPSGTGVLGAFVAGVAFASLSVAALGDSTGADARLIGAAADGMRGLLLMTAPVIAAVAIAAMTSPNDLYALGNGRDEPLIVQAQLMTLPAVLAALASAASLVALPIAGSNAGTFSASLQSAAIFLIPALATIAAGNLSTAIWSVLVLGVALAVLLRALPPRPRVAPASMWRNTVPVLATVAAAYFLADHLAGSYGVAIAAIGLVAAVPVQVAEDCSDAIGASAAALASGGGVAAADVRRVRSLGALEHVRTCAAGLTAATFLLAYRQALALTDTAGGSVGGVWTGSATSALIGLIAGAATTVAFAAASRAAADADLGTRPAVITAALSALLPVIGFVFGADLLGGAVAGGIATGVILALAPAAPALRAMHGRRARAADSLPAQLPAHAEGNGAAAALNVWVPWMSIVAFVFVPLLV